MTDFVETSNESQISMHLLQQGCTISEAEVRGLGFGDDLIRGMSYLA